MSDSITKGSDVPDFGAEGQSLRTILRRNNP